MAGLLFVHVVNVCAVKFYVLKEVYVSLFLLFFLCE